MHKQPSNVKVIVHPKMEKKKILTITLTQGVLNFYEFIQLSPKKDTLKNVGKKEQLSSWNKNTMEVSK